MTTKPVRFAIAGSAIEKVQVPGDCDVGTVRLKLETLSFEIVTSEKVPKILGSAEIVRVVWAVADSQFASELKVP